MLSPMGRFHKRRGYRGRLRAFREGFGSWATGGDVLQFASDKDADDAQRYKITCAEFYYPRARALVEEGDPALDGILGGAHPGFGGLFPFVEELKGNQP
jgi:hypothetical protein